MTPFLKVLVERNSLTSDEAAALLDFMLSDSATDAQIAALLIALAAKGESAEELTGFARTMRRRSTRIKSARHTAFIDTCGTGGSAVKTFNVSTASAFVVAAAGLPVAKHGNVGVTSKAGSADVLRELGVNIELPAERVCQCFDELGVCFMFAPLHHAATKRVAMIRRELGIRTIFNWLGPLTNPAGAPFQIIGVSDPLACERVAQAAAELGTERTWVVRGSDGLDEVTLGADTTIYEASPSGVKKFHLTPEEFGLSKVSLDKLRGGSAAENAELILAVLRAERSDEALDLVLINAAAALFLVGQAPTPYDAKNLAHQTIVSGASFAKLQAFQQFSHSF
ncbi:MAG TPA: anthranilate phosphoribosyltransferase [Blastocatellia bacterium]|nr:anthranilate phosphoribosyltransferase [Blastocatellia bacterium]